MRTLSVARERPVAPIALDVLALVERVAREFRLDYFVTGAMARDVLLYHVFGLETGRATLDIDLAVAVDSWREFEGVKARGGRYPLDLLPFGGLEQRSSEIAWPPDLSVVMNVAGYREALAAAGQNHRAHNPRPGRLVT